ncbi:MAG: DUF6514 family protein [Oscillospiraceae bacterium]|nr:DUF6514 family protein [Oscillospiraceae bacterium]
MYNYAVLKENNSLNDETFGIVISEDENILRTFKDITYSQNTINTFAELCNRCQISPIHFDDVLENFLTDFETL